MPRAVWIKEEFGMHPHCPADSASGTPSSDRKILLLVAQYRGALIIEIEKRLQISKLVSGAQRVDIGIGQHHLIYAFGNANIISGSSVPSI